MSRYVDLDKLKLPLVGYDENGDALLSLRAVLRILAESVEEDVVKIDRPYIDVDGLRDWMATIPVKDLSNGKGLCRVILADDFAKAINKLPEKYIHGKNKLR